jgi:hypothetical protein
MGGLFARHQGHKIAQGYGLFLWAAVLVYAATAWRVYAERHRLSVFPAEAGAWATNRVVPAPHFSEHRCQKNRRSL